jgi:hypothetical protein
MAGQLWGISTLGGYMYSLELSNILRTNVQPLLKFRQFCDAKRSPFPNALFPASRGWPGSDWNDGRHQIGSLAAIKS